MVLEIYEMSTGKCLASTRGGYPRDTMCITPDGQEVWSVGDMYRPEGWKIIKDSKSDVVGLKHLGYIKRTSDRLPWIPSHGHKVTDDGWILNSRKTRLIWLPRRWRMYGLEYSSGGRFLGLLDADGLAEPIILELGD